MGERISYGPRWVPDGSVIRGTARRILVDWSGREDLTRHRQKLGVTAPALANGTLAGRLLVKPVDDIEVRRRDPHIGVRVGAAVARDDDRLDQDDAGQIGGEELLPRQTATRRQIELVHRRREGAAAPNVEGPAVRIPLDRRIPSLQRISG